MPLYVVVCMLAVVSAVIILISAAYFEIVVLKRPLKPADAQEVEK